MVPISILICINYYLSIHTHITFIVNRYIKCIRSCTEYLNYGFLTQ